MTETAFKYIGQGETYRSVPPRDLTQAEYEDLPLLEQRAVTESGAYEPVKAPTKESKSADAKQNGGS